LLVNFLRRLFLPVFNCFSLPYVFFLFKLFGNFSLVLFVHASASIFVILYLMGFLCFSNRVLSRSTPCLIFDRK